MRRRRGRLLAAAVFLLAPLGAGPAAHAVPPTLTPGGTTPFGQTTFLLTLPDGTPVPAESTLSEDGAVVADVDVTPAVSVPGSYGVALVLDTSADRSPAAVQDELAAARAFVAERPDGLPVAIVTYGRDATVAVPFTTERRPLVDALRRAPAPAPGSRVVSAVDATLSLFRAERLAGGALVVLAGGRDEGSARTAEQVAARARAAGVFVFGVGLAGAVPSQATIRGLTLGAGRSLGRRSGDRLADLLAELARQTGAASVLSYPSRAPAGRRVDVAFRSPEHEATTTAVLPARRVRAAAAAGAIATGVSTGRRAAISGLVAVLLLAGSAGLVSSRRKRTGMLDRVATYAPAAGSRDPVEGPAGRAEGGDRMRRIASALEIARIDMTARQLVLRVTLASLVAGYLVAAISGLPLAGLMTLVLAPFAVRLVIRAKLGRQRKQFADQLADALQMAASALRGGHSFVSALDTIVEEAPEPIATEFARIVAAERIGISLERAFGDVVERMGNADVKQVALVASLQRETGGNAAEAMDRVVENLRGRDDVRRLVGTLTAQGRMSRWVLTGIPVGLGLVLTLVSPEYIAPLFETPLGLVALGLSALMCAAGSMVIGKIIDIEV